jgi:hypothetical protein
MMSGHDEKTDETERVVSTIATGAKVATGLTAVVLAAANPALAPVIAAGNVLAQPLIDRAKDAFLRLAGRAAGSRIERLLEEVAATKEHRTAEAAAAEIEARMEEPWARDAVLEAFRETLDALDEAAIPIVAMILAELLDAKAPPTAEHRGVARMAGAMDAALIGRTRRLLEELCASEPEWSGARYLELVLRRGEVGADGKVEDFGAATYAHTDLIVRLRMDGSDARTWLHAGQQADREIFRLLKAHGLGDGGETAVQDAVIGGFTVITRPATVLRLARYFSAGA